MKPERVLIIKVTVGVAAVAFAISAAIWAVIIWQLGRPYDMPFFTSIETARATGVFTGRFLLTAVFFFIAGWIGMRAWFNRRGAK
jgi:hypothetical protein